MADVKISALPAASTPLAGTEVLPIVQGGTTDKVSVANLTAGRAVNTGDLTADGNVAITGTARRITGDFSNTTVANRVTFQTSTVNGNTIINAIPNGTGSNADFRSFNNSDPTNAAFFQVGMASTGGEARLNSGISGTGTYVPMTFVTGGVECMRITAAGNVGIGTSNPARRLHVNGDVLLGGSPATQYSPITLADGVAMQSSAPLLNLVNAAGSTRFGYLLHSGAGGEITLLNQEVGAMLFGTSNTERARITSGGELLLGTTTATPSSAPEPSRLVSLGSSGQAAAHFYTDLASKVLVYFSRTASGIVGSISVSGSSTSYNTSSDYRLKENVVPLTGAAARVQALKPSRFNFIADPARTVDGFIAHEAAEVVPEAVTGEKDAVNEDGSIKPQGIDHSKLVPLLTAALQEALTEIASLKARVAALEVK